MAEQPKPASSRKRNLIFIGVIALVVVAAMAYGTWSAANQKREASVSKSIRYYRRFQKVLIQSVTVDGEQKPALTLYPKDEDYGDFELFDIRNAATLVKIAKRAAKNVQPGSEQEQQVKANAKLAHDLNNVITLYRLDPEYLAKENSQIYRDEKPGNGTTYINHLAKLCAKMTTKLAKMTWQTTPGKNFATSELAFIKAATVQTQTLKQKYPDSLDALVNDEALVTVDAATREEIAATYTALTKVGGLPKHAYIFAGMPTRLTGKEYDSIAKDVAERAADEAEEAAEDSVPDEDDSAPMLESGNIGSRDILDHTTVSWVENDSGNYDVWLDNASDTSFNLAKEAIVLSQSSEDWSVRLVNFDGDADDFRALHVLPIGDTTNDGWSWSKLYCPAGYQRRIITNVSSDTFDKFSDGYVLYEFPQSGTSYMTLGKLEMSDD